MTAVVLISAVLRLLALLAYRGPLLFWGDSVTYLFESRNPHPSMHAVRPVGYSIFLHWLGGQQHELRVVALQHLLLLGIGLGSYWALLRINAPRWVAVLAGLPVLLDGWWLVLGQTLLSETLYLSLVTVGLLALVGRRPRTWMCVIGVCALAFAGLVRTTGLILLPIALVFLLMRVRTVRWGLAVAVVAAALPLSAYAIWSAQTADRFAVAPDSGLFDYGRVAPYASCQDFRGSDLARLCDPRPVSARPGPNFYIWDPHSPLRSHYPLGEWPEKGHAFYKAVLTAEPILLPVTTVRSLVRYVDPRPHTEARWARPDVFRFPVVHDDSMPATSVHRDDGHMTVAFIDVRLARPLHAYSTWAHIPILVPLIGVLIGILSAVSRRRQHLDPAFWLLTAAGLAPLVFAAATAPSDDRYAAACLPVLAIAGAYGLLPWVHPRQQHTSAATIDSSNLSDAESTGARHPGHAVISSE